MITNDQLLHVMPDAGGRVGLFLPWLNQYMPVYEIIGREREAQFLGTIAEESGQLLYTHELWGPTEPQRKYEPPSKKAAELGNTAPGDGFRFRGRGLIQCTGRGNYAEAAIALGVDYVEHPELMQLPEGATRSACWWWQKHGCNALADVPDFKAVTLRVNGGLTHYDRRSAFYARALEVL